VLNSNVINSMLYHGKSYHHTLNSSRYGSFHTREIVYLDNDGLNVYATSLSSSISRVVLLASSVAVFASRTLFAICAFSSFALALVITVSFLLYFPLSCFPLTSFSSLLPLTFSSSFYVLHRFIPYPFRQRLLFSALSSFLERSLSPSHGGDH